MACCWEHCSSRAAAAIGSDVPVGNGLDPGFLADRLDRVEPAVRGILGQVTDIDRWLMLVPVALVLAIAALLLRSIRMLGGFYLLSIALTSGVLVWWFLIRQLGGGATPVTSSVDRYVTGILFVLLAGPVHLLTRLRRPTVPYSR
ncbi:MAG TPA: hypothetical protein VKB17_04345 [Thermoleophilaceae bacterium]|nr:hypothetical protein [Thermoleophilaceae bacterium]